MTFSESQRQVLDQEFKKALEQGQKTFDEGKKNGSLRLQKKGIEIKSFAQKKLDLLAIGALSQEDLVNSKEEIEKLSEELGGILDALLGVLVDIVTAIIDVLVSVVETILCIFPKEETKAELSAVTPIEKNGRINFELNELTNAFASLKINNKHIPGIPDTEINYRIDSAHLTVDVKPISKTYGTFDIVDFAGYASSILLPNGLEVGPNILILDSVVPAKGIINWNTCEINFRYHSKITNNIWKGNNAIRVISEGTGTLSFNPPIINIHTKSVDIMSMEPFINFLEKMKLPSEKNEPNSN